MDSPLDGNPRPEIGVVIAAHQAEPWIAATLESVQAQTFTAFCCVVVDDGSRDATGEVARSTVGDDPRFRVVRRDQGGVSAARNAGLAVLPGSCRYVVFLDSDDLWVSDALEVLRAALETAPQFSGVTATAELIDEDGTPILPGVHPEKLRERLVPRRGRLLRLPVEAPTSFESLATAGRIWPPAVALLRRDLVDDVGGFDEGLQISEDWDLFLRVSRRGDLGFLDRQVAWYRRRAGSLTAGDPGRVNYFNDLVRSKAWGATENTAAQRKAAARAWRTVHLHASAQAASGVLPALRAASRSRVRRSAAAALHLLLGVAATTPPAPRRDQGEARAPLVAVVQPNPRRRTLTLPDASSTTERTPTAR
ncbi:glycosyltransferase family 2 protein [Kineococcus sp. DHX-1]|uniref:glycosyltransferase family 2 protein n=1 Tax=Kineococcus sp. DHX-1 TaxID=3349638 RepID=UPI0036D26A13